MENEEGSSCSSGCFVCVGDSQLSCYSLDASGAEGVWRAAGQPGWQIIQRYPDKKRWTLCNLDTVPDRYNIQEISLTGLVSCMLFSAEPWNNTRGSVRIKPVYARIKKMESIVSSNAVGYARTVNKKKDWLFFWDRVMIRRVISIRSSGCAVLTGFSPLSIDLIYQWKKSFLICRALFICNLQIWCSRFVPEPLLDIWRQMDKNNPTSSWALSTISAE